MSPFQFDSDMSDASTTPVVRIPADLSNLGDLAPPQLVRHPVDLSHLGDLAPPQLVRQTAEHRDLSNLGDLAPPQLVRHPVDLSHLGDLAPPQFVRQTAEHRDLSHLGDLAPPQLVRQTAEHRDPWEIAIEVDYIPFTTAPLTIALSSDLIDVDLQYVPNRRGRRINRSFSRSPAPDRSFPEGHVLPLFRSRSYSR